MLAQPVTVVGGPSQVPAIILAASTIALFKPSGVTYTKATVPSLAQTFTGRSDEQAHTTDPEGSSCNTVGGSGGRQPQVEG